MKNGIAKRGKSWSYVMRIPDPVVGKTKPVWVGGFSTEAEAKVARDKACSPSRWEFRSTQQSYGLGIHALVGERSRGDSST
jgi:hypothetical protein